MLDVLDWCETSDPLRHPGTRRASLRHGGDMSCFTGTDARSQVRYWNFLAGWIMLKRGGSGRLGAPQGQEGAR